MMKKVINTQSGYALLIVLLTITLIGIMAPVIASKLLSSSHQYYQAERNIQMKNLENMGIVYFEQSAHPLINQFISNWEPEIDGEDEEIVSLLVADLGTY